MKGLVLRPASARRTGGISFSGILVRTWILSTVVLFSACSGAPFVVHVPDGVSEPKSIQTFVVSHGWHTGIVVPAKMLNNKIPALGDRFGTPAYYEFGWGDKGFYQAEEITTGLTLRALFGSSGAVVHVVAVPESPRKSFSSSRVLGICLSPVQVERLARFLANSLLRDQSGSPVPLSKGIYGDSQFYEGTGRYSMLNTCNVWTAKGLNSAGFDISPMFNLTAGSVMNYLENTQPADACIE